MSEMIGENPSMNASQMSARTDGGHLAADQTQARVDLKMCDTLSSDTSLLNTKNADEFRQDTFSPQLSHPDPLPNGKPIPEISPDRLFEKLQITDEEKQQARQDFENDTLHPVAKYLIDYLASQGGPEKLTPESPPPPKGYPPGVTNETLRGKQGHNLWALHTILENLPPIVATIRKLTSYAKMSTRTKKLIPRAEYPAEYYAKGSFFEKIALRTHSRPWCIGHWNAVATKPVTDFLLFHFSSLGCNKMKEHIVAKYAHYLVCFITLFISEFFHSDKEGPERYEWGMRYVKRPLQKFFAPILETFYPHKTEYLEVLVTGSALILALLQSLIQQLNQPVETESNRQAAAAAEMATYASNHLYTIAKKYLYQKKRPMTTNLVACLVSAGLLFVSRDLCFKEALRWRPVEAKDPECIANLARYTTIPSKLHSKLKELYPDIANRIGRYSILVTKLNKPSLYERVDALSLALHDWMQNDAVGLARIPKEAEDLGYEWLCWWNPLRKDFNPPDIQPLSG